MKFVVVIVVGAALVFWSLNNAWVVAAIGMLAGLSMMIAEVIWPKPKPAYIDPISRPKESTEASAYIMAILIAAFSVAFAFVVWNVPISVGPATQQFGIYLAAAGMGIAAGMALTARQVSEAHNRWLGAMTPRPDLEF